MGVIERDNNSVGVLKPFRCKGLFASFTEILFEDGKRFISSMIITIVSLY